MKSFFNILIAAMIAATIFSLQGRSLAIETESVFTQGIEAFNSGNYGSAELIFRRIIDSRDDEYMDRAWFYLARSIFQQKQYKSAIYEFNSFLNRCSSSEQCLESRFWMGEAYYNLNDYVKAIEQYNRYILSVKKGPLAASAHDRIASIYFSQTRYEEAILKWEEAVALSDNREDNALRVLHIGESLFKNARYDEAIQRLNPLLTMQANVRVSAMARLICGQIYQMQNDHKKALLLLNGMPGNLLNESPYNEAQYFKGVSNLALGDANTAKSQFELFVLVGKDSAWYYDAVYRLGSIDAEGREWKKAVVLLEEVRKSSWKPELRFQASKLLSKIYMDREPQAAIPYLEESLSEDNPEEHKDALLILARIYINARDFSRASGILQTFFDKYPYDGRTDEALFLQALVRLENGDVAAATSLLKKIQAEYPFSRFLNESHYYLAMVSYKNADYRASAQSLKTYLKLPGIEKKFEAYHMLANCYIALGDYSNADATLNYLVNNYADRNGLEKTIYNYAMTLNKKKMNPWNYYSILMKKYPDSDSTMDLYYNLGNEFYEKGNYAKALYYYSLYIEGENSVEKGTAFYRKLLALMQLKKYKEIIDLIQQGVVPPMNEEQWKDIPLFLSRSFYHTGNLEKTYNIMYSADLTKYSGDDLTLFVRSALFVGDADSARGAAALMKTDQVRYAESLMLIGDHYRNRKENSGAIDHYVRVVTECPASPLAERAKIDLAGVYLAEKRPADAVDALEAITSQPFMIDKNMLLVVAFFNLGYYEKALLLTEKALPFVRKNPNGEGVVMLNLEYHYGRRDLKEFNRLLQYLPQSGMSSPRVLYMNAMLCYDGGFFKSANQYFYQLSRQDSEYLDDSLFYLGMINGLAYSNKKAAAQYFEKLIQTDGVPEPLLLKGKINLALILFENKRVAEARAHLEDVLASSNRGFLKIQAQNLLEYIQKTENANE